MFNLRPLRMPDELQKHVLATYHSMRIGIVIIGIALPLVLGIGGALCADLRLQDSMSAYYHAPGAIGEGAMRNWFVGSLFVVGACLYLYKGFSRTENYLLNAAGILIVAVAVVPTAWPQAEGPAKFSWHGLFAISFFLCIATVALRCAKETLKLVEDEALRKFYQRSYNGIGALMVLSMVAAYALGTVWKFHATVFFVEAAGIWCFAAYWGLKSWELRKTGAEAKALQQELRKTNGDVEKV